MHTLYFVMLPREQAKSSQEARDLAQKSLNDNGFVETESYFSHGRADWFVIGGRWSGVLTPEYHGFFNEVRTAIERKGIKHPKGGMLHDDIQKNSEFIQSLWEKRDRKDLNPLNRDSYLDLGYEDDAQIINSEMLELLKIYLGKHLEGTEAFVTDPLDEIEFTSILEEAKNYIGKYWIVAIDYHS